MKVVILLIVVMAISALITATEPDATYNDNQPVEIVGAIGVKPPRAYLERPQAPEAQYPTIRTENIQKEIANPPAPAKVYATGDCSLVYSYSNWNQQIAYAVCMAESGGNPNAANYNDRHSTCIGSFGLMQLACFWISNPFDPIANMAKANEIYSSSGWYPWGAFTSKAYLRYM